MTPLTPNADLLAGALEVAAFRHEVLSQNIANVNTPGFRAGEVDFAAALEAVQSVRHPGDHALADLVHRSPEPSSRRDGNTVDIDRELGRLGKNSLLHDTCAELLMTELSGMRRAIALR